MSAARAPLGHPTRKLTEYEREFLAMMLWLSVEDRGDITESFEDSAEVTMSQFTPEELEACHAKWYAQEQIERLFWLAVADVALFYLADACSRAPRTSPLTGQRP